MVHRLTKRSTEHRAPSTDAPFVKAYMIMCDSGVAGRSHLPSTEVLSYPIVTSFTLTISTPAPAFQYCPGAPSGAHRNLAKMRSVRALSWETR